MVTVSKLGLAGRAFRRALVRVLLVAIMVCSASLSAETLSGTGWSAVIQQVKTAVV